MDPYSERYMARLNQARPGLSAHPEGIADLPTDLAERLVAYLVSEACQSTHIAPILLGRRALHRIPRAWLLERIERIANDTLNLQDYWEYQRLLELYALLDSAMALRLAEAGRASENIDLREAAVTHLEHPARLAGSVAQYLEDPLP